VSEEPPTSAAPAQEPPTSTHPANAAPAQEPPTSTHPANAALAREPAYETNVARVEEIIHRLDTGEASLGETLELVREGKGLIERCAEELEAVGGALEELRLEDLVARLEGGAAGQRPASQAPLSQSESGGTPK
jgi:exodeoxyribonuclease VII small subunit